MHYMVNAHTQKLKVKAREPEITATLIRRTQPVYASESTLLILPKKQIDRIGIKKGSYVKVSIYNGDSLLIEKVD
jgi:hypothetical protein